MQTRLNDHPTAYYEFERPNVLESLKTFTLHPYFQLEHMTNDTDWHGLLHERVKLFRKKMDEENLRDFELEKDRCRMYAFYRKHELPLLPIHGEWRSLEEVQAAVSSGEAFHNVTAWPAFWKA